MDKERFHAVCEDALNCRKERAGIGTLGEKTLHVVLKNYFEPDQTKHEMKVAGYVADIVRENGIVEIQTQGFDKLRKKLAAFLVDTRVTIVYPIAQTKWLCWIDKDTGVVTKKRRSPKIGTAYHAFFELYKIKQLLNHPNLSICIVLLELEEYRHLDGWSKDKKRGSTRYERIPIQITEEFYLNSSADYDKLIPPALPQEFTTKDYAKATRLSLSAAQTALHVLFYLKILLRIGKQGRLYLYSRNRVITERTKD